MAGGKKRIEHFNSEVLKPSQQRWSLFTLHDKFIRSHAPLALVQQERALRFCSTFPQEELRLQLQHFHQEGE